jgi:dolichol kinase
VRDLIHVGASIWVFGWGFWNGPLAPIFLVMLALGGVLVLPRFAARSRIARGVVESMSNGEERWAGIVAYVFSYALFTTIAVLTEPYAAACALLALSWGDGIGGLVGRKLGRTRYRLPWGKTKSLEGSIAVACFALLGVFVASVWFSVPPQGMWLAAIAAASAEAIAPRASDNLAVPVAVFFIAG